MHHELIWNAYKFCAQKILKKWEVSFLSGKEGKFIEEECMDKEVNMLNNNKGIFTKEITSDNNTKGRNKFI